MPQGLHPHRYRHSELQQAFALQALRTSGTLAIALLLLVLLWAGITLLK